MSNETITAGWLAERVGSTSARGIAGAVADLVRRTELAAGAKMPTVRAFAAELGVSPTTVAEAWTILRRHRVLLTQGRRGTVITGPPSVPHPARYERIGHFGGNVRSDLAIAAPDPALLPDLSGALTAALSNTGLNTYQREQVTPALEAAGQRDWPFESEAMLAVGGGYEGMLLVCQTQVIAGDRVAVEEPTAARLLDLLDFVGAEVLPVPCDAEGPRPDALAEALRRKPVAFVYQPRGHTPCGHAVGPERSARLAELLEPTGTVIVEDDGLGPISSKPLHSLGRVLPERTVLVRSYSKSYGPDLRLALVGGAGQIVDRIRVLRSFGTGWTSRILQDALAALLDDPAVDAGLVEARARYAERRGALSGALAERGVHVDTDDGLALWVPVREESETLVTLAAHGITVVPGSRCQSQPGGPAYIRVSTATLDTEPGAIAELADVLALAAHGGDPLDAR